MANEMVTPCSGPGIAVADGKIQVYGPRRMAWDRYGCALDQHNGIRWDPATGKIWSAPDSDISWTRAQPDPKTVTPGGKANTLLGDFTYTITSRQCMRSNIRCSLADGFASGFLVSGDWWVIRRVTSVTLNGASTHADSQSAWFMAPSTGTWLGAPLADWELMRDVGPNVIYKVRFQWWLDVLAGSTSSQDTITIRFPHVLVESRSFP